MNIGVSGAPVPVFSPQSSGASVVLRDNLGKPVRVDVYFGLGNMMEEATQVPWSADQAVTNVLCDEAINLAAGTNASSAVARSGMLDEHVSNAWAFGCVDDNRGPAFQKFIFGNSGTVLPKWLSGLVVGAIK